ncbi:MAG: MmcQ/YjbR family DNA-binding protein [Chloroflexaceae bacterium]|jgi:predicted DNA-binding protein (MmcQ/YjbR family)|nr:MmcQ/YjbR family DNA-binding protein [Chloroflexaceae bacterium]
MVELAKLRTYLLSKPGAEETYPFGPGTLVFKVVGKMFALVAEGDTPLRLSLKCDPAHGQFLRDQFPAVRPRYHLDKRHWLTVTLDGSMDDGHIQSLIDESYRLVVQKLSKAARQQLAET